MVHKKALEMAAVTVPELIDLVSHKFIQINVLIFFPTFRRSR